MTALIPRIVAAPQRQTCRWSSKDSSSRNDDQISSLEDRRQVRQGLSAVDDPEILRSRSFESGQPALGGTLPTVGSHLKITTNIITQVKKGGAEHLSGSESDTPQVHDGEHVLPHLPQMHIETQAPANIVQRRKLSGSDGRGNHGARQMQDSYGRRDDGEIGSSLPLSRRENNETKRRNEHRICGIPNTCMLTSACLQMVVQTRGRGNRRGHVPMFAALWCRIKVFVAIHWLQLNLFSRVQCNVGTEPLV